MLKPNLLLALTVLAGISLWKALPSDTRSQLAVTDPWMTPYAEVNPPSSSDLTAGSEHQTAIRVYETFRPVQRTAEIVLTSPRSWDPAELGAAALASGGYQEAIGFLSLAIQQDPEQVQAWIDLGEAYLRVGNCDCAIVKLSYAAQLDPSNPRIYNLRAQAYEQKGNYLAAAADARTGLELDPNHVYLWQLLSYVEHQNGEWDRAERAITTALSLAPLSAELWEQRAALHTAMGESRRAFAEYRHAASIRVWRSTSSDQQDRSTYLDDQIPGGWFIPTNPLQLDPAQFALISPTTEAQTATQVYLQHLNQWVAADPEHPQPYLHRAAYFWYTTQLQPQITYPNPTDPALNQSLDPEVVKRLLQLAVRDLDIAIVLDPTLADLYLLRSWVHADQGEYLKAERDLKMAEQLGYRR